MGAIVSVDLAHTSYDNVGIVVLAEDWIGYRARLVEPADLGLTGRPDPERLAAALVRLCADRGARVLLLDGPQAWADPATGLGGARACERALNCPGKTGLPGCAKPAPYLPFIAFSIAVFGALVREGASLLRTSDPVGAEAKLLALESFPTAAWRGLGVKPLPGKGKLKGKALDAELRGRADALGSFELDIVGEPSHDELQATVAGLAGVSTLRRVRDQLRVYGEPPRAVEGTLREGYIVLPSRPGSTLMASGLWCRPRTARRELGVAPAPQGQEPMSARRPRQIGGVHGANVHAPCPYEP